MKNLILISTLLLFSIQFLSAQRYMTEIFEEVEVKEDVLYGNNATILAFAGFEAINQPLFCDIYSPKEDSTSNRPLAIIVHDGIFVPQNFNGGCYGTKKDADVVELAKRLARMGYVAACIDYRLGWDPVNPDHEIRLYTLINAIYRGVQDLNTSVKFFKRSNYENYTRYRIDPNKIVTIGFVTGAAITYGAATLQKTEDTWIPPYITSEGPMVIPQINGDVNVDMVGIVPPGLALPFPAGDTLCYPNHLGYDTETHLSIQLGGSSGHKDWVTEGDTPMMSYHVFTDPIYPFYEGSSMPVYIPGFPILESYGPGSILPIQKELSNNDIFSTRNFIDPYSIAADVNNEGIDGLYKFLVEDVTISTPWSYSYSEEPYGVDDSNCPTWTPEIQAYRDTIVEYFIPRACLALDLGCDLSAYIDNTSTDELTALEVGLEIMPNPAVNHMLFKTSQQMESVLLFNAAGQLVQINNEVSDYEVTINRKKLSAGLYVAMIRFENGYVAKKISFQ